MFPLLGGKGQRSGRPSRTAIRIEGLWARPEARSLVFLLLILAALAAYKLNYTAHIFKTQIDGGYYTDIAQHVRDGQGLTTDVSLYLDGRLTTVQTVSLAAARPPGDQVVGTSPVDEEATQISSASLSFEFALERGALLEARGLRITFLKLDPYLNIDPGTMNPFQHGEVYVTHDGAETDLDLGHYERFTSMVANKDANYTTGKIYASVIEKERRGDYLGATVQVIPHITDEIKSMILAAAEDVDVLICEVGGTVGELKSKREFDEFVEKTHILGTVIVFHFDFVSAGRKMT